MFHFTRKTRDLVTSHCSCLGLLLNIQCLAGNSQDSVLLVTEHLDKRQGRVVPQLGTHWLPALTLQLRLLLVPDLSEGAAVSLGGEAIGSQDDQVLHLQTDQGPVHLLHAAPREDAVDLLGPLSYAHVFIVRMVDDGSAGT